MPIVFQELEAEAPGIVAHDGIHRRFEVGAAVEYGKANTILTKLLRPPGECLLDDKLKKSLHAAAADE
jgi:hypothetical protein